MRALAKGARQAADAACRDKLVRVDDRMPGYRRVRRGRQFVYRRPDGKPVRDPDEVARIRALAIPPAYEDVWICPLPNGHLQATGIDARGRKQYRYHPHYRAAREDEKFERLAVFGRALPRIRARVERDLQAPAPDAATDDGLPPLPRQRVLATLVRLLDSTCVRIGNEAYQRDNGSYGLTTLRNDHVRVRGSRLRLAFRGKGGVPHDVSLEDAHVAEVVRHCQRLPGHGLFEYHDEDGSRRRIDSADVNRYLCEAAGQRVSAKDFRTWHGSVQALELARLAAQRERRGRPTLKHVIAGVAERLRNTMAVCRKSYIHPEVLEFVRGARPEDWLALRQPASPRGLKAAERRLLAFLERPPRQLLK